MTDRTLHTVGQSVERNDGVGFVTGRTRYTGDLTFPRMLHLKMVRSPLHHARIRGVDLSEAERVPGFVRALTHADVPHNVYTILGLIGVEPEEEFVLPVDRVRYKGEPIVAILAETEAAAYEAVARVRLDLEELPAVFDMDEALAPGAPVVTHWGNNTFMYEGHECRRVRYGDVEAGFATADHIVEGEYRTSPIEHAPLETTGAIAVPEANGRYTVYTNTQAVYFSLDNTSIILQLQANRLRFIGGTVGGGFGGKVDVIVEPLATLGAMLTGRPVRYVYSRSEEMQVSSTRSPEIIRIKDGVMADGTIVARKVTGYMDCGAYSRQTPYAITKFAANAAGPYRIPNVWIDGYCVYTNRTPTSAMRGFGVTMGTFAVEVQMDKIARLLGLDPWTVRFRNAHRNGDIKPHRKATADATLIETMQAAAALVGHELAPELAAMTSAPRDAVASDRAMPTGPAGRKEAADHGDAARHRHGGRQLSHRHEPGRRPVPGPDPRDHERVVQRGPRRRGPRPGAADGDGPDRGRDARRPVRPDRDRDGRHGHRTPRHGHLRQPGDPPGGQRGQGRRPSRRATPSSQLASEELEVAVEDLVLDGEGGVFVAGSPDKRLCDRGPRVAGPVPVRAHDRRPWRLDEAQERRWTRRPVPWTRTPPRPTRAPSPRSRWTPRRAS